MTSAGAIFENRNRDAADLFLALLGSYLGEDFLCFLMI